MSGTSMNRHRGRPVRTACPPRRRLVSGAVGLLAAGAGLVATAEPAAAAGPPAHTTHGIAMTWGDDITGAACNGHGGTAGPVSVLSGNVVQTANLIASMLIVLTDGTVWGCGENDDGELTDSVPRNTSTPHQLGGLSNINQVASGGGHGLALDNTGAIFSWGLNQCGELGVGSTALQISTVQRVPLSNAVQIAAGQDDSMALLADGTVWAWGDNRYGQLGTGTLGNLTLPRRIPDLSNVVKIATEGDVSLALLADGTVKAWGLDGVGDGTTDDRLTPFTIAGLTGITDISAGGADLALRSDGTVMAWGANQSGEVGDGTTSSTKQLSPVPVTGLTNVTQVSATPFTSLALTGDGSVWAWGNNLHGALGIGTTTNPVPTPTKVVNLTNVTAISAGEFTSSAVARPFAPAPAQPSGTAMAGGAVGTTVAVTAFNGYSGSVSLSVGAMPAGVTAAPPTQSVTVGQSATVWLSAALSTPTGTYPVTITATGGGYSASTTYQLTVAHPATVTVPDLSYMNPDSVGAYLADKGLVLGTATPVMMLCQFYDEVIDQDIAAGTVVPFGTAVSVDYADPIECM